MALSRASYRSPAVRGTPRGRWSWARFALGLLVALAGPSGHVGHARAAEPTKRAKGANQRAQGEPSVVTRGGAAAALQARRPIDEGSVYRKSWALVIGIDHYRHLPQLDGAERDARRVAEFVRERGFDTQLLLGAQATKGGILRALEKLIHGDIRDRDRVLIYFAGHGVSRQGRHAAMGYLMPVEGSADHALSEGIEMAYLQRVLAVEISARHVLFVADACYSGLALTHRGTAAGPTVPGYMRMIAEGSARAALVAGKSGELAHEFRGHGVFTYYLLQGLRGAADKQEPYGVITSQELAAYVKASVSEQASIQGYVQTPQFRNEGEGEILFFTEAGGSKAADAAPAPAGAEAGAAPEAESPRRDRGGGGDGGADPRLAKVHELLRQNQPERALALAEKVLATQPGMEAVRARLDALVALGRCGDVGMTMATLPQDTMSGVERNGLAMRCVNVVRRRQAREEARVLPMTIGVLAIALGVPVAVTGGIVQADSKEDGLSTAGIAMLAGGLLAVAGGIVAVNWTPSDDDDSASHNAGQLAPPLRFSLGFDPRHVSVGLHF